MSDLNDLIATNAINAFNSGLQTGIAQERERIIKLLEKENLRGEWDDQKFKHYLIELIKGEQK